MASGVVEKGNNGLFLNEIEFVGDYSQMVRYLKDTIGLFPTYREVYLISAAVGYYLNKHESQGLADAKFQPASIFPTELMKKRSELRFIYRMIMLSEDKPELSIEDYMNRAFRDDPDSDQTREMLKENMTVFNSYVCGGLEYLYRLFENQDSPEKVSDTLYDFVHSTIVECGFAEEEELPEFDPE